MKSAGKARSNGLYRHIRTSKEIIRNLLNYYIKYSSLFFFICQLFVKLHLCYTVDLSFHKLIITQFG